MLAKRKKKVGSVQSPRVALMF